MPMQRYMPNNAANLAAKLMNNRCKSKKIPKMWLYFPLSNALGGVASPGSMPVMRPTFLPICKENGQKTSRWQLRGSRTIRRWEQHVFCFSSVSNSRLRQ